MGVTVVEREEVVAVIGRLQKYGVNQVVISGCLVEGDQQAMRW